MCDNCVYMHCESNFRMYLVNNLVFITNFKYKNGHRNRKKIKHITFISSNRFINTYWSKPNYWNNFIFGAFRDLKLIIFSNKFDIQIQLSRNKNNITIRDE